MVRSFLWLKNHRLWAIVILGAVARVLYVFLAVDLTDDFYWEYGEIARNIHAGNGYSLFYAGQGEPGYLFQPGVKPAPSAFMPPGYVLFVASFLGISDVVGRNLLIFSVHVVLSSITILLLYLYTERFIGEDGALYSAAIGAFLPEFIYSTTSFTPTIFSHVLILTFLFVAQLNIRLSTGHRTFWLGVIGSVLLYFRAETALFLAAFGIYVISISGLRRGLIFIATIAIIQSPWQIRNFITFDEWIPLTTSGGQNFFRGHNPEGSSAWRDETVARQVSALRFDKSFEPEVNRIYFRQTLHHIGCDPARSVATSFLEVLRLWLINPSERRSTHVAYLVPWILLMLLSVLGIVRSNAWVAHKPLFFYLCSTTVVAAIFFTLPRYQTTMKVALIPFAGAALSYLVHSGKTMWFGGRE